MSASSSSVDPSSSSAAAAAAASASQRRSHHDGSSDRKYTPDQKAAVIRVRKCSPTAFYEILAIEKTATDLEIRKAYRKLSLLTHPDKNGYEGADEAFKMVSRAFQILSDADKKARYDKFGGDPESRFGASGSASAGGSSPFARGGGFPGGGARAGTMYDDEISPEEIFNRFFGGGFGGFGPFGGLGGGGLFDTGPSFVFNVGGGPGIRIHQFGGGPRMRRTQQAAGAGDGTSQQSNRSLAAQLLQLLPLLILVIFPLISSLFSTGEPAGPSVRYNSPSPPHTVHRVTPKLKIDYYLNPAEVSKLDKRGLYSLDQKVEVNYVSQLRSQCQMEVNAREKLIMDAQGWFFQDTEKMQRARELELKSCKKLEQLGVRRR
ncbi:hypothetical protein KEM54_005319 [Ascosphaera aggregata]|nr:hypothetical protein KEM54_005319 [Ascosphaera aggregata]